MARKARVEYQGAVYHVLDRGDRREAIFRKTRIVGAFWRRWGRRADGPAGGCMRMC